MWRAPAVRRGRVILSFAHRQLATEASQAPPAPPPPPPRKSGGFGFFKFLGISIPLAAGGVTGYAWYDQDFRKQLEDNVPYVKDVFENILPPQKTAAPVKRDPEAAQVIQKATMLNVQETNAQPPPQQKIDEPLAILPSSTVVEKDSSVSTVTATEKSPFPDQVQGSKNIDPSSIEHQLRSKEEEEKADNAALEVAIHKLLESGERWTAEATEAQEHLAESTRNHTKLLRKAMDDTTDILQKDVQWEDVALAFKERENASMKANDVVAQAKNSIEKLRSVLEEGKKNKVTKANPAIFPASKKVNELTKEMMRVGQQVRQAESEAKVMVQYKDLVDKGRKQFQMELESLVPDVKLGNKSKKLSEDELNALIAHAHRRIEQLQKQIAEQLSMEKQRLTAAMDSQKEEHRQMTLAAVSEECTRMQNEFTAERQKMEMEYLVHQEVEVRKQLARQAAAHSDHLKDVLAVQEKQLESDFSRKMSLKMLEEREKFQTEVSGWISRLKGIEAAVDARAASEKIARSAQDLWLACIALNSTIMFGNEEDESTTPLRQKVEAVLASGDKHPFVESVVKTLSDVALDRGVQTEAELRNRFVKVARVSRRLGLVTDSNASLYKYLVSFLHSFITFDHVQEATEHDIINLDDMDNFKLVAHAQYWMEQGNLSMAVRFMNQLTGEARKAASDWLHEATLLLETKQVASTLTAYASASGLAATF